MPVSRELPSPDRMADALAGDALERVDGHHLAGLLDAPAAPFLADKR